MPNGFLPISKQDLIADGIDRPDFVYVSGDAYVDHSSFGTAIICRLLQSRGYCVALICHPTLCNPMDCTLPSSSVHGDSPGKNTRVGCHALLQHIFPTQGLNLGLSHCWQIE